MTESGTAARLREVEEELKDVQAALGAECNRSVFWNDEHDKQFKRATAAEQERDKLVWEMDLLKRDRLACVEHKQKAEAQRDGLLKAAKFVLEHAEMLPGLRAPLAAAIALCAKEMG